MDLDPKLFQTMSHWCRIIEKQQQANYLPPAYEKNANELQQVKNIKQLNQRTVHPILIFAD